MQTLPKILILTAEYGKGHTQAARVLKQQFMNFGVPNVIISSIYAESYPTLTPISEKVYLKSFTAVGKPFYFLFYYGIEKIYDKRIAKWFTNLGRKRLTYLIETEKPDIIINTFPVLATTEFRRKTGIVIPTFNVITDYCVHKMWVQPEIDHYYVATNQVKKKLCQLGVSPFHIHASGIPIRSSFEMEVSRLSLLKKYGLAHDKKVVLIMAGAFGVMKDIHRICEILLTENDCQVVTICGNKEKTRQSLETLALEFKERLHVYGYHERVDELFRIASFMITKPGGLTLTEATAAGLPVILYKPVPGQEKGNANFFEREGGALVAYHPSDICSLSSYLLHNEEVLVRMKKAMHSIYRPNAAETIARHIIEKISSQQTDLQIR